MRLPGDVDGAGVRNLPLRAFEPWALDERQVRLLKSVGDGLEGFRRPPCRRRGRGEAPPVHGHARPLRDRAIVFRALSTGLRRAELVGLDLDQLEPTAREDLRAAKRARPVRVRGKGGTERTVFLSADARRRARTRTS